MMQVSCSAVGCAAVAVGGGKPSRPSERKLRDKWRERMRLHGFARPWKLPAARDLRSEWRGQAKGPADERDDPLCADVCAAVQAQATKRMLFGSVAAQANVEDSLLRFDDVAAGVLHRDCVALRRNYRNLQFVAVLQGEAAFKFEKQVRSQTVEVDPDLRKAPVIVKAGHVIVFMGSRYAHAVTTAGRCLRVSGWVCAAGSRVVDKGGAVTPAGVPL